MTDDNANEWNVGLGACGMYNITHFAQNQIFEYRKLIMKRVASDFYVRFSTYIINYFIDLITLVFYRKSLSMYSRLKFHSFDNYPECPALSFGLSNV